MYIDGDKQENREGIDVMGVSRYKSDKDDSELGKRGAVRTTNVNKLIKSWVFVILKMKINNNSLK